MNKYWYFFSVLIIFFLVHPVMAQEELPEDSGGGSVPVQREMEKRQPCYSSLTEVKTHE